MAFIGNTNTTQAFTPAIDYFSGTGSATAFTLSRPVASVAQVQVTIDNVAQNPSSAYTISGSTITFTSAPLSGTNNIYVYYTSPITQVIAPGQGTVTAASMASSTGTGAGVFQTSPTITTPTLTSPIITGSTPQVTIYTSGSGTYTTPANTRYLIVELCGGGSGGAGGGSYSGGGSAGGNTTFGTSLLQGNGASSPGQYTSSSGGGASLGGATGIALTGGAGMCSQYGVSNSPGGNGGCNPFGGGGSAGSSGGGLGGAGAANSGGGGGGGGNGGAAPPGSAGSAGGYVKAWITSPSATYSYAVGAGGAGASNTYAGGAGGSGVIIVTAYF